MSCEFPWTDSWGDHRCHRQESHLGFHRCECDATHRENDEEARKWLREELTALQDPETEVS